MEYKLLLWSIRETIGNKSYYANGNVYNNPKFNEGKNINTSVITDAEYQDDNLVIHTLNSVYRLPLDSFDGYDISVVERMTDSFKKSKKIARPAAEKLLSAGECLICSFNVIYYSKKGIVELKKTKKSHNDFEYEYPDEKFRVHFVKNCMTGSIDISYISCSDDSADKYVYVISAENSTISKYSYSDFKSDNCWGDDDRWVEDDGWSIEDIFGPDDQLSQNTF